MLPGSDPEAALRITREAVNAMRSEAAQLTIMYYIANLDIDLLPPNAAKLAGSKRSFRNVINRARIIAEPAPITALTDSVETPTNVFDVVAEGLVQAVSRPLAADLSVVHESTVVTLPIPEPQTAQYVSSAADNSLPLDTPALPVVLAVPAPKGPSVAAENISKDGAMDSTDIAAVCGVTPKQVRSLIAKLANQPNYRHDLATARTRQRANGQITKHYKGAGLEAILTAAQTAKSSGNW